MKITKCLTVLLVASAVSTIANAGMFGFEDIAGSIPSSTSSLQVKNGIGSGDFKTKSEGVTASLEYFFDSTPDPNFEGLNSGMWAGGAVSNSTVGTGTGQANDLNAKPAKASSGDNFGVLYLPTSNPINWAPYRLSDDSKWGNAFCSGAYDGYPNPTSLLLDKDVEFVSIDLAMTSYVYESLTNGDSFIGRVDSADPTSDLKTVYNTEGAFYVLRIYELAADGAWTDNYVDAVIAQNVGGNVSGLINEASQWATIDISGLNHTENSAGLGFSVISSFSNAYGMTAPAYLAIDNVVFSVPEPAEYAALFGALALVAAVVRRRNVK